MTDTGLAGKLRSPFRGEAEGPGWVLRETVDECHLTRDGLPEAIRLRRADALEPAVTPEGARARVERLEARLARPDAAPLLMELARCCGDLLAAREAAEAVREHWHRWRLAARLVESAWPSLVRLATVDGEARMRLPLVARARFLLLTYPFRLADPAHEEAGLAFGSLDELAWRARRARDDWLHDLLRFQDRPMLATRGAAALDSDARLTVFNGSWPGGSDAGARLSLHAPSVDGVVAATVTRDYLLPRFMLADASRVAVRALPRQWAGALFTAAWLLPLAACLVVLAVAAPAAAIRPDFAELALRGQFWLAVTAYAVVAAGVAAISPAVAYPACLRIPAVSALGLVALLSLFAERLYLASWQATAFLLALSLGYLVIEARNHDLAAASALARSLVVWLLGLAHAAAVAAVVLRGLGRLRPGALAEATTGEAVAALWFAASAGLALGVFLQVLWDERPITAPLSHLRWTDRT